MLSHASSAVVVTAMHRAARLKTRLVSLVVGCSTKSARRFRNRVMDLLTLKDWTADEILATVEESLVIKDHPERFKDILVGKSLGMLFQKTSTRTRTSFEVGMTQMGGHAVYMDWQATNFALADLKGRSTGSVAVCRCGCRPDEGALGSSGADIRFRGADDQRLL